MLTESPNYSLVVSENMGFRYKEKGFIPKQRKDDEESRSFPLCQEFLQKTRWDIVNPSFRSL